ncbi:MULTISPECIES: reverse transcriptase family protein [Stenotrophomonas]|uniref:reverse transcriptase family protein n=1 Tax=Stenotrophomonas TaxID=40323 RepID=UPI00201CC725|nr:MULTISPECIES: reverse transcriptase family protein [Stenotrophomonas]MBN5026432.1 RNA-directed DNA polymerase [Stenotrophomonas maltophilia]MDH1275387.1 reverse transcriptase family protein [Stenotrophomonas sp. GD03937]MDH1486940.1 reverse transcriptase family protein [Stenotrophomonas sp. GD03712]UQY94179.1 reverse transcriptase family protein [Stenotrophomonas maltophilia]WON69144.1 reverse transcriptase family protein [Stenotrophomonas maltophilia]
MTAHSLQSLPDFNEYSARFTEALISRDGEDYDPSYLSRCLSYAKGLLERRLPVIFDREHLCALTGYSSRFIESAVGSPHLFYRNFEIPKKSGGFREISEPLPSLKDVQRWIYQNLLLRIPVSVAAKAFVPGKKLRDGVRFHVGQKFVIRVDIADFFPSITRGRVFGLFRSLGYSSEVSGDLASLCCVCDCLPQGGVCSPYLSNIIMRSADRRLLAYARENSLRYTRYADDFTVSGQKFSKSIIEEVMSVIKSEGFTVNQKKTRVSRSGGRQVVLGHVVNGKVNAPREYRRELRKVAYYVDRFGLDNHLAYLNERRSSASDYYLGKASFVLSANHRDRDALDLKRILLDEVE